MVQIRVLAIAAMCLILAIGTAIPHYGAATPVLAATVPQLVKSLTLPGSDSPSTATGKFPRAVSHGNQVYIAANPNANVSVWSKLDSATSIGDPIILGNVVQSTNYANASIATAADGTTYAVWITYKANISIRRKLANGDWEAAQKVYSTSSFLTGVDITIASDGKIFVTWNEDFLYRYRVSTNGGANWSGTQIVTSKKPRSLLKLASGPNGEVVAGFAGDDGNVYVALWNGSSFDTIKVTPFKTSGDYFADPTVAVAPNGKLYIAFRNGTGSGGIFYSERQTDKTWPVSKLAGGAVYGSVSISADANNNLHVFWAGQVSGGFDMWYAFKPVSGDWQGPVQATGAKTFANVNGTGTVSGQAYGHGVAEIFSGDRSADKYYLFASQDSSVNATPVIEGGTTPTNKATLSVSFTNVNGAPDGVRYHWDAAPTDADTWLPFQTISVPRPAGVSPDACETHILYVQVRKGTTVSTAIQASKIFDIGVQAAVNILNPHLADLPPSFGLSLQDVYVPDGASNVSDGDPYYTRESMFYLGISGQNDCSNLSTFNITGSTTGPITSNSYSHAVALPGSSTPGSRPVSVLVADALGNTKPYSQTLIYDPADTDPSPTVSDTLGLPVLATGGSVTADSANSIIRTLSFKGIDVTDNLYGQQLNLPTLPAGKQFWGVWMANTISPTISADDPSLLWYPVKVETPNSSFTVKWDIFTGLNIPAADLRNKPGDYYVFVRFLDGAGNPSTNFIISKKITLAPGYDIPTVHLPALSR
jgi:hypothetical protein